MRTDEGQLMMQQMGSFAEFDRKRITARRWDGTPFPKAWFVDVADDQHDVELSFLQAEIYQREIQLPTRKIDAFNRFSDRI